MYWLKEKFNKLTQRKPAEPKNNLVLPAPSEEKILSFKNPLFNYLFDVGSDLNEISGKIMPVIKKLSLDEVMSTVGIAEWQNIKVMAPVLAADMMTSGLLYLMKCSWDDKKDPSETNLYCTLLLGGCMAIQTGAWVYDTLIGRQVYLKLLIERQLMTTNLRPSDTAQNAQKRSPHCTKECGSLKNMTHGNMLKMAHFYTNQFFIDQIIQPLPFIGPGLSSWFGIMAKGRCLLDLTTPTYCRVHETLNPGTVLAAGIWYYACEMSLTLFLTRLGVSQDNIYTRQIIQEIALIFSTSLLLHVNFPVISKKSPAKHLDLEKQNLAIEKMPNEVRNIRNQLLTITSQAMYVISRVIMSNPMRYIEEAVEWAMGAALIGTAMQIKASMQEESDTQWEEIKARVEEKLNHPWVRTAQIQLLPNFLHTWDNLANHPPIRDQWKTKREKLICYIGKTFEVRKTAAGKMASYSPKYAGKILQLFLGIQASVAQKIIEELGEVQTRLILKQIYWWLGLHGVTESAGLTGVDILFPEKDAILVFTQPAISKESLSTAGFEKGQGKLKTLEKKPVIIEESGLPILPSTVLEILSSNEPFIGNEVPATPFSSPTGSPKPTRNPAIITGQRGTFFPNPDTRSGSPKGLSKADLDQETPAAQLRRRSNLYSKNKVWSKESLAEVLPEKSTESKLMS